MIVIESAVIVISMDMVAVMIIMIRSSILKKKKDSDRNKRGKKSGLTPR